MTLSAWSSPRPPGPNRPAHPHPRRSLACRA
jgi:hypothetical protein